MTDVMIETASGVVAQRFCRDCQHAVPADLQRIGARIGPNARCAKTGQDLVTGAAATMLCSDARRGGGVCGHEGKLWDPRPQAPAKRWWRLWV